MNKTKVFAVRVRDKYDQGVEDYINSKISNVTWIRDELPGVDLQWNKLRVMNMDIDEPVLVIDIDTFYINDYVKAIDYPIERGEFLTAKSWWKDTWNENYSLCGGFFYDGISNYIKPTSFCIFDPSEEHSAEEIFTDKKRFAIDFTVFRDQQSLKKFMEKRGNQFNYQ